MMRGEQREKNKSFVMWTTVIYRTIGAFSYGYLSGVALDASPTKKYDSIPVEITVDNALVIETCGR